MFEFFKRRIKAQSIRLDQIEKAQVLALEYHAAAEWHQAEAERAALRAEMYETRVLRLGGTLLGDEHRYPPAPPALATCLGSFFDTAESLAGIGLHPKWTSPQPEKPVSQDPPDSHAV